MALQIFSWIVKDGRSVSGQKQMCCNRVSAFVRWHCSSFVFAKRGFELSCWLVLVSVEFTNCRHSMTPYVWGFVQWPIRDPGSRAAKSRSWVKFRFLDQISKRPCQPDMLLDFILSMSIYSDSHCTKPDVGCS